MVIRSFLNFLFPKQCLFCRTLIREDEGLSCGQCLLKLPLIQSPFCKRCGQPLPAALFQKKGMNPFVCPACRTRKFPFSMSRSVMHYDEDTSPLILNLKYGDRGDLAPVFADLSFQHHIDLFQEVDFIVPVPLSFRRLFFRKYNQSALIGRVLSKRTQIPMLTDVLKRRKFRFAQGHLSFEKRHENVRDAFAVMRSAKIEGKTVLLVDDVMASGATVLACARVLKKVGADEVRILTIARSI